MFVQWMLNWLVAPSIQNLPGDPVWDPVGFLKLTFRSFQTRRKSSNYRMIHMNHVALTWAHQVPLLSISLLSNLHWASCLLVCPRNAMHNDFLLHSALNSWPWGLYSSSVLQRHLACQGPQLAKCGTTLPDVDIFLGPSYMCLTHCCMLIMPCRCSIICWMREIFGPKFGVWCRCWYPWRRWNQTLHSSSSPSGPIWFWRGKKVGKYVAQVPPSERWWPWRWVEQRSFGARRKSRIASWLVNSMKGSWWREMLWRKISLVTTKTLTSIRSVT